MNKSKIVKNAAVLISPLLSFAVLLVPYSWANQAFIVDWFGCGCPKVDELGNIIHRDFNANDFSALFWLFITLCVTVASVFLSKKFPKEKNSHKAAQKTFYRQSKRILLQLTSVKDRTQATKTTKRPNIGKGAFYIFLCKMLAQTV